MAERDEADEEVNWPRRDLAWGAALGLLQLVLFGLLALVWVWIHAPTALFAE